MTAFVKFFTGIGQVDFLVAFRNLLQHTRRTLFLGAAIAAVTAIMVLLNGLSTGTSETMLRSATTLMSGHVNVGGFYKITEGASAPVVTNYADVLKVIRTSVPELDYVAARGRGFAKIISDTGSIQCGVAGIDIGEEPGFKSVVELVTGNIEDLKQPNTALIFEGQAKKLDVKVGDVLTISAPTTRGTNNTSDVRVIADRRPPPQGSRRRWVQAHGRRPASVLHEVRKGEPRVVDRPAHRCHQLGRRALLLQLDPPGDPRLVCSGADDPARDHRHRNHEHDVDRHP
jgi:hypothetical protein